MDSTIEPRRALRVISVTSIVLGALGGAFSWWLPLGMVFSIAGLLVGLIDAVTARRRSVAMRLSVAGVLISLAALILCIVIAALGLQLVTRGG